MTDAQVAQAIGDGLATKLGGVLLGVREVLLPRKKEWTVVSLSIGGLDINLCLEGYFLSLGAHAGLFGVTVDLNDQESLPVIEKRIKEMIMAYPNFVQR